MKITLIEPAMMKKSVGLSEKRIFYFQPLALGVLAGLTPPDVEVEFIDDRFEIINFAARRDLVGISVKTFTARRAYQLADQFRQMGIPVILGGHHVSLLPDEARQHADALFVGEAEMLWPVVLADARRGQLQPIYQGGHELEYPPIQIRRDIFKGKHYLPVAAVETARGCPYNCNFCSVTTFFGRTFRRRAIPELVDEIRALDRKTILFVDDNIVGDLDSAKELFSAIAPLKIRWMSQASISMTRDLELMRLMQKSGCAGVLVGIESLFGDNLKNMRKSWNVARQDYAQALRIAREFGVAIIGSFIVGLDFDTDETLNATVDFAVQQKLFAVLFNMLTPFPQTELYQQLESAGRLRYTRWWLDEQYRYGNAAFHPKNFSAGWLEQKRMAMYRKFYGPASIARRLCDLRANLQDPWHALMYLSINLPGYAQERARTGRRLG